MRKLVVIVVTLSLVSSAAVAFGYVPWRVNMLPGNGNFEVIEGVGASEQRFWCEAAKFAAGPLRAPGNKRMYILTPNGRAQTQSKGYGVGFTIAPTQDILDVASGPGDGGNYSVSVTKVGYNLSVSHARGFCGQNVLF